MDSVGLIAQQMFVMNIIAFMVGCVTIVCEFGQDAMAEKGGRIYVVSDSTRPCQTASWNTMTKACCHTIRASLDCDNVGYIIMHGLYTHDCEPSSKAKLRASPTNIVGRGKLDGDGPTIKGYGICGLTIVFLPGLQTDW